MKYLSCIHLSLLLILIYLGLLSDEIKSVYVRNLSPTVSPSEIEDEFKNFGRIRPDGVVIRSRKVCISLSPNTCINYDF